MTYRNLLFRSINVSIDRLRIITGYTGIENEIHRTTLIEKKISYAIAYILLSIYSLLLLRLRSFFFFLP